MRLRHLHDAARPAIDEARRRGLMHATLEARGPGKRARVNGHDVVEFMSCSYLGLDTHSDVIAAAKNVLDAWGVHVCCARSRMSIEPLFELEAGLSRLFGGHAITFPTVTAAHMSVMPLLAEGLLAGLDGRRVCFIYDRFAHASMQYLRPLLAVHATVVTCEHNDLHDLERLIAEARNRNEAPVYVGDGVYSMGGVAPIRELVAMSRDSGLALYIDDAHGTSIYGTRGEGYVVEALGGALPPNVIVPFSLAKGFGCNGGGVVMPTAEDAACVRELGQTYAFSAPLDFSIVGAALAALRLHEDGTVAQLQTKLRENTMLFQDAMQLPRDPASPIQMIVIGGSDAVIAKAAQLMERGYFVPAAFFPVVPKELAQLRVVMSAAHHRSDIVGLADALRAS